VNGSSVINRPIKIAVTPILHFSLYGDFERAITVNATKAWLVKKAKEIPCKVDAKKNQEQPL